MLIWLVLGCGQGPSAPVDIADCVELECVGAWATRAWPEEPERVLAEVGRLPSEAEKVAVVLEVAEAHPGRSAAICEVLAPGPVAGRCRNINERLHLWTVPPNDHSAHIAFSGDVVHLFGGELPAPYPGLSPVQVPCEGERVRGSCQTVAADVLAREQGDVEGAAARCAAIPEGIWRSECFFDIAEALCERGALAECEVSARICLGAGDFAAECFVDIAGRVARLAPSADDSTDAAWAGVVRGVERGRAELATQSGEIARRYASLVWSEALYIAYSDSDPVGAPFAALPASAHPHVRAALAARGLLTLPPRSLESWVSWLGEQEAGEAVEADAPSPRVGELAPIRSLWSQTLPAERAISATSYLGDSRRALHSDPSVDRVLCVLEAAGRATPPTVSLLEEGVAHSDSVVRWTAVRLLGAVAPDHPALEIAADDPSPLVSERARAPQAASRTNKGG